MHRWYLMLNTHMRSLSSNDEVQSNPWEFSSWHRLTEGTDLPIYRFCHLQPRPGLTVESPLDVVLDRWFVLETAYAQSEHDRCPAGVLAQNRKINNLLGTSSRVQVDLAKLSLSAFRYETCGLGITGWNYQLLENDTACGGSEGIPVLIYIVSSWWRW